VIAQFPPQGLKVLDAALNLGELRRNQLFEARPKMLAAPGVCKGCNLPDAGQRKTDLLGAADEPKALEVSF
jgi:hypothetical protein